MLHLMKKEAENACPLKKRNKKRLPKEPFAAECPKKQTNRGTARNRKFKIGVRKANDCQAWFASMANQRNRKNYDMTVTERNNPHTPCPEQRTGNVFDPERKSAERSAALLMLRQCAVPQRRRFSPFTWHPAAPMLRSAPQS